MTFDEIENLPIDKEINNHLFEIAIHVERKDGLETRITVEKGTRVANGYMIDPNLYQPTKDQIERSDQLGVYQAAEMAFAKQNGYGGGNIGKEINDFIKTKNLEKEWYDVWVPVIIDSFKELK